MAPIVHGLEAKYSSQIRFSYLDIDDPATETFRRELGFSGFRPHIYLLGPDGAILQEWIGFTEAGLLDSALQSISS